MRLELTPAGILALIRKRILAVGLLELRIERDPGGRWRVTRSGWQPLNNLEADSPAVLLRAIAIAIDENPDPGSARPGSDARQLPPPAE